MNREHASRLSVRPEPDHLRPALERAQTELDARLTEACDNHEADESTGQLIKLEELLSDAAHAAKEAISIRRRLDVDRRRGDSTERASDPGSTKNAGPGTHAPDTTDRKDVEAKAPRDAAADRDPSGAPAESVEGIRDFVDADGKLWHVWEVPAEQLSARARPGTYAGEYESGWLAFEAGEGGERRRLPGYPRDWQRLPNDRIEALCRDAHPVMKRRRGPDDAPPNKAGEGSPPAV